MHLWKKGMSLYRKISRLHVSSCSSINLGGCTSSASESRQIEVYRPRHMVSYTDRLHKVLAHDIHSCIFHHPLQCYHFENVRSHLNDFLLCHFAILHSKMSRQAIKKSLMRLVHSNDALPLSDIMLNFPITALIVHLLLINIADLIQVSKQQHSKKNDDSKKKIDQMRNK